MDLIIYELNNFAGASICASGVFETCPGYISPFWYLAILAIIILLSIIVVKLLYAKKLKNVNSKSIKILLIVLIITLLLNICAIVIIKINGSISSEIIKRHYNECVESQDKIFRETGKLSGSSCEY